MREVIRENMHRDSKWPSQSVEEHVIQPAAEAAAREIGIASLKEKPCFLPTSYFRKASFSFCMECRCLNRDGKGNKPLPS